MKPLQYFVSKHFHSAHRAVLSARLSGLFMLVLVVCVQASIIPYQNTDLPAELRVADLMDRMTLKEKVGQMCQYVGFNYWASSAKGMTAEEILNSDSQADYKGFQPKDIADKVTRGEIGSFLHVLDPLEANQIQALALKSRLQIPILIGIDAIHGNAMVYGCTVYPSPITLASSFSDAFAYRVGRETALEMRATGSHWSFTPNIDVARDPRWGRVGETFGEDPLLVGNLGKAMIQGLQLEDLSGTDRVIACAKHLIAGSEPINGLNFSPMDISERNLREIFLKPYQQAVDAGVYSMMSAHHELNAVPCVMNSYLMETLVRDEMGFQGFFVSDWMDIERLVDMHYVAESFEDACALAVNGGTDMHMHGPHFLEAVVDLVENGVISKSRVDAACAKILLAKFKLGLFENPMIDLDQVAKATFTDQHCSTALEIARKSIVLLKNDSLLPLAVSDSKKILVTGPNAHNNTLLGDWALAQPDENVTTVYEGIQSLGKAYGYQVDLHPFNENIRAISDSDISAAVDCAKNYDQIILVVGDNSMRHLGERGPTSKVAGENVARAALDLAGNQLALVQSMHAAGKPIIVVLINGKPIAEPWLVENIPAIIEAWEPGSFGGQAIAEILFGEINPSGKLPITIPRSVGHLQMVYNHKPTHHKKKYAFEPVDPLFPFGFGLSYSDFAYSDLKVSTVGKGAATEVRVSVQLLNTSAVDGEEVVQLYFRDAFSAVTRPVKELLAYKRVFLPAGSSQVVEFSLPIEALAYLNEAMERVVEAGEFIFKVGGSSADTDLLSESIFIERTISF